MTSKGLSLLGLIFLQVCSRVVAKLQSVLNKILSQGYHAIVCRCMYETSPSKFSAFDAI